VTVGASQTGDGIVAAEKLGAALDIMEDAWWGATVHSWVHRGSHCQSATRRVDHRQHVGHRFMNESMPYVEACHRMYGGDTAGSGPGENIPAWLVFDQKLS